MQREVQHRLTLGLPETLPGSCVALRMKGYAMLKPDTFSMEKAYVDTPEQFLLFLEALIRGRYGNIIRAKGLIPAGACALRFDVADGRYSVRLEDHDSVQETDQNAVAVFIGHGIAKQAIRRVIHQKNIAQRGKIRFTAAVNQR